ncbi:hypothetical protein BJX68DRAFT_250474 [Aspergillus pseudodeflectus]|uniref:Zn(2)-C6 fungal-type domain-containing protein n=1 Tax=Aspergillus pseudodeflectus TaxID=176178 RepID=A0ABR4J9H1_9EURO
MNHSPQNDKTEKERKMRASRPKVRTGCATCKSRHKKCDEGQPSCLMCIRAGRACEYRETVDRRRRHARGVDLGGQIAGGTPAANYHHHSGLIPAPAVFAAAGQSSLDVEERQYLDFFRKATAAQCAGYFYDEFWQRLVHQVSEEQPAVCHAVIALGSLNYIFLQLRSGASNRALQGTFTLQQCNKSIVCLRQILQAGRLGRQSMEVALITCILLVSTLLFQENAQCASHHLRSGLKLLKEYTSHNPHQISVSTAIERAFAGVHLSWLAFSTPEVIADDSFPSLVPRRLPEISDDISTASDFVVSLARLILLGSPRVASEADTLFSELCAWRKQTKASTIAFQQRSQRDRDALVLLKLWSEVLYVILSVETQSSLEPREIRYDAFLAHFQHSIELAKRLLTTISRLEPVPTFSVNLGVIAPLFFCGFKCRDWLVRQEVLLLLRRWRWQEGIWSSDATARLLTRVIGIETGALGPEDIIPMAARIKSVHAEITGSNSGLRLWYRRAGDENWTTDKLDQ